MMVLLIRLLVLVLGVFGGDGYDNLPARNADQSQLFKTYPTGSDATYSTTIDIPLKVWNVL